MSATVPNQFQEIFEKAIATWAGGSRLSVQKDLVGGRSRAAVLLVDIAPPPKITAAADQLLSGEFVLKLDELRVWDPPERHEQQRHETARLWNPEFAERHIPRLLRHEAGDRSIALLYEIASRSLVSLVTADNIDAGALAQRCFQIGRALLADWNKGYSHQQASAKAVLDGWLGYRLDPKKATKLHDFIAAETGGRGAFAVAGRLLVNPLWFCQSPVIASDTRHVRFAGLLHGDLHPGNLLLERTDPRSEQFWMIDFALSHSGSLGYDHAYLELALLLRYLDGADPERMLGILDALAAEETRPEAERVPVHDMGLVRCVRTLRNGAEHWQKDVEPNRRDPFLAQQLLARVATALNWCNKPLDVPARRLALSYGAWAAWQYLHMFHGDAWREVASAINGEHKIDLNDASATVAPKWDPKLWTEVWEESAKFDGTSTKFILLAGRIMVTPDLASLGLLPWSAVIDLDPNSDQNGLHSSVAPVLERVRSVKQFGRQSIPVDFERGTAWLMAGGWPSRHEPEPESIREWRRVYLPHVRDLCASVRKAVAPQPVKVLVLPTAGLEGDRLARMLEAIDEGLGDLTEILVLGSATALDDSIKIKRLPLPPQAFVAGVRSMYGTKEDALDPEIPGADGQVAIPIDRLRNLEEDLDVLHSRILADDETRIGVRDDFWRGNPPTWADLHAGADIERKIHAQLTQVLGDSLRQSRNHTVELHHSPGAGGTTAALRAAWTLRGAFPTAVLRRVSRMTVDRIDQLFQLAQRPVLLVAEAAVLPASAREELYRGFADRNSRVVILYVIRTTQGDRERPFGLFDPMEREEAAAFRSRYAERTEDQRRRVRLEQISTSKDPSLARYRSPFFYGLITYEREFQGIDRYIETHLEGINYRARKIMLYLALVTRYSQIGIDERLVLSLLGLHPDTRLDLDEAIGQGPARLILRHGRQRKLLHPLIAEEVLRKLLGGHEGDGWKDGLKDLSTDLINDVVRVMGGDSIETNRLFVQLFILRDLWYETRSKGRPRFAELIGAIPSMAGQHQVLQLLTEACPQEAHYWNHLGRHHFYEMRQDFSQAEAYLMKAVDLSPDDSYHHHSLGMVRRFWVEHRLSELFQRTEAPSAEHVLEEVQDLVDRAAASFAKARELNPEDEHGYITQIQMILHVAERLVRASGKGGLNAASKSAGHFSEWLRTSLVTAEDLLSRVQHMRGQGNPSNYELTCASKLSGLYGDFDRVIHTWEAMLQKTGGPSDVRRALASAYYARCKRVWSALSDDELRRIIGFMESNLREDPTNDRDVRMWFQAYRRVPEFSYLEALDRLEAWATRSDSLDAHFYLYILHYLRLREGAARSEELVLGSLDKCKQLARGRRSHSYEWLGSKPHWCPLVHHSELGEWDKAVGFYPYAQTLALVTGTIETIKGPKAGTIRLGERIRAFFVPSTHQWASKDINAVVQFYLGFSYDGFRAWAVHSGPSRQERVSTSTPEAAPRTAESELLAVSHEALGQSITEVVARPLLDDGSRARKARALIMDLLAAAENRGEELPLTAVGQRLAAEFPGMSVIAGLGFSSLSEYLRSLSEVALGGTPERLLVLRAGSALVQSGTRVLSSPKPSGTKTPQGPSSALKGPKESKSAKNEERDRLLVRVRKFLLERLTYYERANRICYVVAIDGELREAFSGGRVYRRLGFGSLVDLLLSIDGIGVEGGAEGVVRRVRK